MVNRIQKVSLVTMILLLALLCHTFDENTNPAVFAEGAISSGDVDNGMDVYSAQSMPIVTTSVSGIDIRVSLLYDNAYHERVLIPGKHLTVVLDAENSLGEDKTLNLVLALYNEDGRAVDIKMFADIIAAGSSGSLSGRVIIPLYENIVSAKIMIWNSKDIIMPYRDTVVVTLDSVDYFGDDISVAQPISAANDVSGKINSASDIDVFAYTAAKTGLYIFETYGETDTYAQLKDGPVIIATDDNSGTDSNFRLSAKLTAGYTYHLLVHGNTQGDYILRASYAIGNIIGTVSPVKYYDHDPMFNEAIEGKVTLTTFDTNEFVATMHLKEWSSSANSFASFDISGIHGGTYLVSFTRPGYLTRYRRIVLDDDVVDLGSVTLLAGDVNGDGVINSADSTLLQSLYNKQYGDTGYLIEADLNGDKIINSSDLSLLTPNLNKNSNIYGENISYITVSANKSGDVLNISGTAAASSVVNVTVHRGTAEILNTNATVNAAGAYSATCNLTKAGTYTVFVTAANRVFDASCTINY